VHVAMFAPQAVSRGSTAGPNLCASKARKQTEEDENKKDGDNRNPNAVRLYSQLGMR